MIHPSIRRPPPRTVPRSSGGTETETPARRISVFDRRFGKPVGFFLRWSVCSLFETILPSDAIAIAFPPSTPIPAVR